VTDPQGAVLFGAKVTLVHPATNVTREMETDETGRFQFLSLPPGTYTLKVEFEGFKTARLPNLDLLVNIVTRQDVMMQIGAITETVQVEAVRGGVNTTDATVGQVIITQQIQALPLEGLDPTVLLSLQPGAVFIPTGTAPEFDTRSGSVSGSRSDQTNITLDGVDNNDPIRAVGYEGAIRSTMESIQEFRVTTTNANADQGRSSAAQVALVTRSGTNELHGSAYYSHRNEFFAANEWFLNAAGVDRRKLRKHIAGGSLGGPLMKERWFLFGNYEDRHDIREDSVARAVPSWAYRHGYIQYECDVPSACLGGTFNIAGQSVVVPAGSYLLSPAELAAIDPLGIGPGATVLTYFQQYPEANDFLAGFDNINIPAHRFAAPLENRFRTMIIRTDFNIDTQSRHQLYLRGTLMDDALENVPQFAGQPPLDTRLNDSFGLALGYRAVLRNTLVNHFTYGLNRLKLSTAGQQDSSFINFRFIDNLAGYYSDTDGRTLPVHHLGNDLLWTRGTHTLSMGTAIRFTRNSKFDNGNSFHFFTTNPSWIPGEGAGVTPGDSACTQPGCSAVPAVASYALESYHDIAVNLMGLITQATAFYNFDRTGATLPIGEPISRRFATNEYEFYFQDQWNLNPSLTLTLGVRYGLYSPPWETHGNQVAPSPSLNDWFRARRALMEAGQPASRAPQIEFALGGPKNNAANYFDWDYNNFSPRLGLAWSPKFGEGFLGRIFGDRKMTIRVGYSLVYDRIGSSLVNSFDTDGSFGMSTQLDSTFGSCDETTCPRFTGDIFATPDFMLPPSPGAAFPATPPGGYDPGSFAITNALDSGIRTPYAHTYNLFVARSLPWNLSLEVGYVGRSGRNLLVQRDLAMPINLVDSASGMSYFEAASMLAAMYEDQGLDISQITPMPFWENMFPDFGPTGINAGYLVCDIFGADPGGAGGFSATQVAYDYWNCLGPDYSWALYLSDRWGFPSFSRFGDHAFFDDQFSALSAWSSIGRSEYHALQLSLRRQFTRGLGFDFNYTYSKSLDHGSEAEYVPSYGGLGGGGVTGFLVNSWDPDSYYSFSDFDMRHQINANWVYDLPFGRGKRLGAEVPAWLNQVIGGWQFSGLLRWTTGLPATVGNGRAWPTNWQLTGNATCIDPQCRNTQTTKTNGPNIFRDPQASYDFFRRSRPGEAGDRNILRGEGFYGLDVSMSKRFNLPFEGHAFVFRWDVFNLTNTPRFDTASLNMRLGARSAFGSYSGVLGPADGAARVMQLSLRYQF
jgi:hypothetical protein